MTHLYVIYQMLVELFFLPVDSWLETHFDFVTAEEWLILVFI